MIPTKISLPAMEFFRYNDFLTFGGAPMKQVLLGLAAASFVGLLTGECGANPALTMPIGVGKPMPPPLSLREAQYYQSHPAEWNKLLRHLPKVRMLPLTERHSPPPVANTWTPTTHSAPGGVGNPLLLTDGTVIAHSACTTSWYKLTPDGLGSYVHGTWTAIASFAAGYTPLYFASQILNDGRVVVNGGEYNNDAGPGCHEVWQTNGAIYNPVANTWTPLAPPAGWTTIGDAQSIILPNTKYMLANCCTTEMAILNASTLTWTPTGSSKFDVNDEEGWALLHDGTVLTADAYVFTGTCGMNTERYTPSLGSWASAGNTTTPLADCGPPNTSDEVGPIVVRPGGTAVGFSGVTSGAVAGTSIYNPSTGWGAGPNVPTISGQNYDLADAPGVALPSGNIFFAANPGKFNPPTHFFEFNAANAIVQRVDTPNAPFEASYEVNFLMLPTGQVLETDGSTDVEIYTPGGTYNAAWKPTISSVPSTLTRGSTYSISGTQLTGITHGVYGDDVQAATNFPIVRLTNNSSHGVKFAKTSTFSSRSDKPGQASTASFKMPPTGAMPAGSYSLVVIANGIPSSPVSVTVN
jgi:hypothetical protein